MSPLLIGLCGPAGSGKDTVASMLAEYGRFSRYTLALPLKRGLEVMLGIPLSIWDDRVAKEEVLPWLGKSPRQLAQTLGTEWGRQHVHPDLWVQLMLREWEKVQAGYWPRRVVTDVRFDNEALAVRNAGGTVWKVERESVPVVAAHSSENGVSPALIDGTVKNYGSLEQLRTNTVSWLGFLERRYAK